ncbi:metallophosphoesterase [Paenibacillus sp. TRM 82003]|nr:metallophosphoesterase [Paenibacillus sp. TRM 82003]
MARWFTISDIHGHVDCFATLLQAANYRAGMDRLLMLGDFIDADEPDERTIAFVRTLTEEGALALPGNQERRLLERDPSHPHAPYLAGLPYWHRVGDVVFVHAGVRPGIALERQTALDLTEIRADFWESPDAGYAVVFGHTPTHRLGAPLGEPWRRGSKLGIDTGAKHGGRLTLFELNESVAYSCSTSVTQAGQPIGTDVRVRREPLLDGLRDMLKLT